MKYLVALSILLASLVSAGTDHFLMQQRQERLIVANGCGEFDKTSGAFKFVARDSLEDVVARTVASYFGNTDTTQKAAGIKVH